MKWFRWLYIASIAVAVAFLAYASFSFATENARLYSGKVTELATTDSVEDGTLLRSVRLGKTFQQSRTIAFFSAHSQVRVLLDDKLLYSYGYIDEGIPFMDSKGSLWNVVTLPVDAENGMLVIELKSPYGVPEATEVLYGLPQNVKFTMLYNMLPQFLVDALLMCIGLVTLLVVAVLTAMRMKVRRCIPWCASFITIIGLYLMTRSGALQIMCPNMQATYLLEYVLLMLSPVLYNAYVGSLCKHAAPVQTIMGGVCMVTMVVGIVLQVTGTMDLYYYLSAAQTVFMVNSLVALLVIVWEIRNENTDMRLEGIPAFVTTIFGGLDGLTYYMSNQFYVRLLPEIGMITFTTVFVIVTLNRILTDSDRATQITYGKKLSRMDLLTDSLNRQTFDTFLEDPRALSEIRGVVAFDLCGTESINLRYSHAMGDRAIQLCCECINHAFLTAGDVYRMDSDRFLVLLRDTDDIMKRFHLFDEWVEKAGANVEFPFSIAYAWLPVDGTEESIRYAQTHTMQEDIDKEATYYGREPETSMAEQRVAG